MENEISHLTHPFSGDFRPFQGRQRTSLSVRTARPPDGDGGLRDVGGANDLSRAA